MALLKRVVTAMECIAPLRLADHDWDNVGLLLEAPFPSDQARKVFLTIDLTNAVLHEALNDPQVGIIISYHPPIFRAWKRLALAQGGGNSESFKQELMLKCAAKGVSVYSPHTSLDSVSGGINDWLATCFGKAKVTAIIPSKHAPSKQAEESGNAEGSGRLVTLDQSIQLQDALKRIKSHLKLDKVRLALPPSTDINNLQITTIAICPGSGASLLLPICRGVGYEDEVGSNIKKKGQLSSPDLLFTGEMSHHEILQATATGATVVLCEHTNTERGYLCDVLQQKLIDELGKDIDVIVSKTDKDPIQII